MLSYKWIALLFLSLLTAYIFSKTVERSLAFRGLKGKRLKFYKFVAFTLMLLFLLLLSFLT